MNNKKFNIGILGCADIAKKHVIPAIIKSPYFNLHSVGSENSKKHLSFFDTNNIKYVDSYTQIINNTLIDIVYIPLPNNLHYKWAKKALLKNKHVIVEKPLSSNFNDVKDLNDIAKKNNLALLENFQFRFHSQIKFLLESIQNKLIGDLKFIRSDFCFPFPEHKSNIRYDKDLDGGALFDTGVYPLRVSQLFLGPDIDVSHSKLFYDKKHEVDVAGIATLEKKSSNIFSQISYGFGRFYQNSIKLYGSKGKMISKRIFTSPPGKETKIYLETDKGFEKKIIEKQNHFINMLYYFSLMLKDDVLRKKEYKNNFNQSRLLNDLKFKNK